MIITNWLARAEGNHGLVLPNDFTKMKTRIYGNVYGHPNFEDGEFVQTGYVLQHNGSKIVTAVGEEFILQNKETVYMKYLEARGNGLIILKNWKVVNGLIAGKTLDGENIQGKVIRQNCEKNICELVDGRLLFVDWLSKSREYTPEPGVEGLLVFGIERCMPDIFGKHFRMFRKN